MAFQQQQALQQQALQQQALQQQALQQQAMQRAAAPAAPQQQALMAALATLQQGKDPQQQAYLQVWHLFFSKKGSDLYYL